MTLDDGTAEPKIGLALSGGGFAQWHFILDACVRCMISEF